MLIKKRSTFIKSASFVYFDVHYVPLSRN